MHKGLLVGGISVGMQWGLISRNAQADAVPVYGGPTLPNDKFGHPHIPSVPPGNGSSSLTAEFGGPGVNSSGTAIGVLTSTFSSLDRQAMRWSAAGGSVLSNLGSDAGNPPECDAYAINSAGTTVGSSRPNFTITPQPQFAVRWDSNGNLTKLDSLGGSFAVAEAVNDAGTAVGCAAILMPGVPISAVRWDASGIALTQLGNLGTSSTGTMDDEATKINVNGTAIGYAEKYDANHVDLGMRAARWDASGTAITELGNLGTSTTGSTASYAIAINTAGTIVGVATKYNGSGTSLGARAVRWDASSITANELGNLGVSSTGVTSIHANAINDVGTIVGDATKYNVAGTSLGTRATRWTIDGTTTELGLLGTTSAGVSNSFAYAINSGGVSIGFANKYDGTGTLIGQRAVYWDAAGSAVDLNTLIDPSSGWTLTEADAISDTDWIAGVGQYDPDGPGGQAAISRAFLMQVPEPSSIALVATSFLAFAPRRRR